MTPPPGAWLRRGQARPPSLGAGERWTRRSRHSGAQREQGRYSPIGTGNAWMDVMIIQRHAAINSWRQTRVSARTQRRMDEEREKVPSERSLCNTLEPSEGRGPRRGAMLLQQRGWLLAPGKRHGAPRSSCVFHARFYRCRRNENFYYRFLCTIHTHQGMRLRLAANRQAWQGMPVLYQCTPPVRRITTVARQ